MVFVRESFWLLWAAPDSSQLELKMRLSYLYKRCVKNRVKFNLPT